MSLMDNAVDVTNQDNMELDWDSEISEERENRSYRLLPEGDYAFKVKSFEKERYEPKSGSKIPKCWKAVLHLLVYEGELDEYPVECRYNLFLVKTQEWALSSFFLAIGQKKHGQPLRMNWQEVPGSQGWCHIRHREWNDKQYNEVAYFLDPDKAPKQPKPEPAKPAAGGFQAGKF